MRPLFPVLPEQAAPYVFPLWVDDPAPVYQTVRASGIPVFRWDVLWPNMQRHANDTGVTWAEHVFQLGCHQDLDVADLERMAARLAAIVARARRPTRDAAVAN